MDYSQKFEENRRHQIELIKNHKPFHSKKIYNGELNDLINKVYGFKNSFENHMSVDAENNPIPWMTYPAVSYFSQLDLTECDIFEWGSGNSTLYFSKLAKSVTTIESNKDWFDYVNQTKPSNVNLILASEDNYATVIQENNKKYDIISIDGDVFRRFECAFYAVDCLKESGMIIVDNSDWLENTTKFLRSKGLIQIDFTGLSPINNYASCTSIFLSRNFNIQALSQKQPGFISGGLKNIRD